MRENEYFVQEFAFSSCLFNSLSDTLKSDLNNIDFTREFLFDVGGLGLVYKSIDSLAAVKSAQILSEEYSFQGDRKLIIGRCLEFSRSNEIWQIGLFKSTISVSRVVSN